ncbi:hypothetical protein CK203_054846 [Vitis vinifera]|uniref:Uncharacterized protein n=1 Tax=Vitis vinifera TaxID=29760 RepID=A0A438H4L7_VITVI|nr:hypothetical protein CK203_054846 [Vitis vinifera]
MSSKGETSNKKGGGESSLMLQAMQQQFEHMNVVFSDIWDQMDRQDPVNRLLCERSVPKEPLMLEGKEGIRALLILMTTMRMSLKMKRIKLH